ncbi:unnamed protein product [Adineta steineri]|uniref:Uncharacterized protein n=1 Tax=Adineta steineri TaxID=433720 RepID=A0A814NQA5_9BILA|nr:unnamed protein product [Adineta steineri]CAF1095059.1 unnamed protein product [Adineta steineri]CAF1390237.1 unnamed protein product [Adineta steineri]
MGCCVSVKTLDQDKIHSSIILQAKGETYRYHGTTELGQFQTMGNAEIILTEDGIYSQVIGVACCGDRGYLHIPLLAITNIREQDWFNGLYRLDRPHLIITYKVPNKGEYQAGWQMNQAGYEQWKTSIERILEEKYMLKLQ